MTNRRPILTGESDFRTMIRSGAYVFDKTPWIRRIFEDGNAVTLITRPRRFGKTFTQTMLRAFFEMDYSEPRDVSSALELFRGMKVLEDRTFCEKHLARWPVVFLSLKDVAGNTFDEACDALAAILANHAAKYEFLLESDQLSSFAKKRLENLFQVDALPSRECQNAIKNSLFLLTSALHQHFGRPCLVLLDEYDVPLLRARAHGYYDSMQLIIQAMMGRGLKDSCHVRKSIVTGCLRIVKESIFTDINNFECHPMSDVAFGGVLGFTQEEAHQILTDFGLEAYEAKAKAYYDGYRFGQEEIYCPWDLLNFCDNAVSTGAPVYSNYWINTSANAIIEEFIEYADATQLKLLKRLLAGESIEAGIKEELSFAELDAKHSIETLLTLLYTAGYVTSLGTTAAGESILRVPNEEVRECFERRLIQWFSKGGKGYESVGLKLMQALETGDFFGAQSTMRSFLNKCASVRDGASDAFYHGTMLGLLGGVQPDDVTSNREAGDGYFDIVNADAERGIGVVIELKRTDSKDEAALKAVCRQGIQQIYDRRYYVPFLGTNIHTVQLVGVAFNGKTCCVAGETRKLADLP